MKKMRLQKKNKGFTLVELIVAVAIMAIIVTPLLGNFVQSAKINKKSRDNLDGMNMAQDIMEGMASFTGEEVINMFESKTSLKGTILAATTTYGSHGDEDGSGTEVYKVLSDGTATGTPQYADTKYYDSTNGVSRRAKAENSYNFFMNGVIMGNHTFNFDITMTSRIKNKKAEAATIDKTFDAVYTAPDVYTASINDPVNGLAFKNSIAPADFAGHVNRRITMSIVDVDTAGTPGDPDDDEHMVKVTDQFVCDDVFKAAHSISDSDACFNITTASNIFTNSSAKKPENVYIYYPASIISSTSVAKEEFWVQNMTNQDVNVFLIRQKSPVAGAANNAQSAVINISDEGPDGNQHTYLITNARFDLDYPFDQNLRTLDESGVSNTDEYLADMYDVPEDLSNPGHYTWPTTHYLASRCTIKYRRGALAGYSIVQDAASGDVPAYNDLVSDGILKRNSASAYDVDIIVYEVTKAGGEKKVAQYSGALSN